MKTSIWPPQTRPFSCAKSSSSSYFTRAALRVDQRLPGLPEGVVLVAAAADGADGAAVGVDQHLGADALRRGAVGDDDGDQRHVLGARRAPRRARRRLPGSWPASIITETGAVRTTWSARCRSGRPRWWCAGRPAAPAGRYRGRSPTWVTPGGTGNGTLARPGRGALHEGRPDRQRRLRAAQPEHLVVVEPDPDDGQQLRREADEPGVAQVVGGAGLAGGVEREAGGARRGAGALADARCASCW